MNRTTRRALPAVLLAAIVLAVAFAGGATAAKLITGKAIKDNTVTTRDIKNKTLKSPDVKDGSLSQVDFNGAVKAKLNAPRVKGYEVVTATELVESAGQSTVYVACTAGKVAVGGGGTWKDVEITDTALEGSKPMKAIRGDALLFTEAEPGFADAWAVSGQHNGLDPQNLTAYVVCVSPN